MASFPRYVSSEPVFAVDPLFSVLRVSNGARTFIIRISGGSKELLNTALTEGYALNIKIKKSRKIYIPKPNANELFYASYATLTLVRDGSPPKVIKGVATTAENLVIKNIVLYSENMFEDELAYFNKITYGLRSHFTPAHLLTENE